MGVNNRMKAEMKIAPRRPKNRLTGSDNQQPLFAFNVSDNKGAFKGATYMNAQLM
jgi:hypothetical protein